MANGKLFRLKAGAGLEATEHAAAAPVSWPLAHAVRAASQSLGSLGCQECHAPEAPFFFGQVAALGPLKTASMTVTPMYELEAVDAFLYRLAGRAFKARSVTSAVMASLVVLRKVRCMSGASPKRSTYTFGSEVSA